MAGTIFTDAHAIVTRPVPGPSMAAEHWRDLWPIDPMLKNYPTEGPNDPVPIGYNPAPINYLPPTFAQPPACQPNSMESSPPPWAMQILQRLEKMEQKINNPAPPPTNTDPQTTHILASMEIHPPPKSHAQTTNQSDLAKINLMALPPAMINQPKSSPSPTTTMIDQRRSNQPAPTQLTPKHTPDISNKALGNKTLAITQGNQSKLAGPSRPRTWPTKLTLVRSRRIGKQASFRFESRSPTSSRGSPLRIPAKAIASIRPW